MCLFYLQNLSHTTKWTRTTSRNKPRTLHPWTTKGGIPVTHYIAPLRPFWRPGTQLCEGGPQKTHFIALTIDPWIRDKSGGRDPSNPLYFPPQALLEIQGPICDGETQKTHCIVPLGSSRIQGPGQVGGPQKPLSYPPPQDLTPQVFVWTF